MIKSAHLFLYCSVNLRTQDCHAEMFAMNHPKNLPINIFTKLNDLKGSNNWTLLHIFINTSHNNVSKQVVLKLQISWRQTGLDNIIKDRQLNLDLRTTDSWPYWCLIFEKDATNQCISLHFLNHLKWTLFILTLFPQESILFEASNNIHSSQSTNHGKVSSSSCLDATRLFWEQHNNKIQDRKEQGSSSSSSTGVNKIILKAIKCKYITFIIISLSMFPFISFRLC